MWRMTTPDSTCLTAASAATCFQIDLSGQSVAAGDPLGRLTAGLRAAEAALPSAAQRIEQLLTPRDPDDCVDVTGMVAEPSSPEDELLRSIDAWRSDVRGRELSGKASELAPLRAWWLPTAVIETRDGTSLVAATVLDVSGPVTSTSGSDASPAPLALHARAVKLVRASRIHAVRSLEVAAAGSVAAAARLRCLRGALHLLPSVWGCVHRVLDEPS